MVINKAKILAGRKVVDIYRAAHSALHSEPWHEGIPEEHTPPLKVLINALKELGFTSKLTEFEPMKTAVLTKFFNASKVLGDEWQ